MTTNQVEGLDTLRVLAKKIAPGQEHLDVYYETLGKREWYGNHGTGKADNVFVSGSQVVIDRLLKAVVSQDSYCPNHHYTWGFESRKDAERFVSMVFTFEGLSFWHVGLSRSHALASEAPLYGYFCEASDHRLNVSEQTLLTERVRAQAWPLFRPYGRQIGVSAVFVTQDVMERGHLSIPKGSKPMMVLDYEKSDASAGAAGLKYKPDERQGTVLVKDVKLHYSLFQEQVEAQQYFAAAAAVCVGKGWHFGLNSGF